MVKNIVEIRKRGTVIVRAHDGGGIGALFVPRIGETVFGSKVIGVDYVYDAYETKATVDVE